MCRDKVGVNMQKLQGGFVVISRWMEKDTLRGFLLADTTYSLHLVPLEVIQDRGYFIPYLNAQYDAQFKTLVGTGGASLSDYPAVDENYTLLNGNGIIVLSTVIDVHTRRPIGVVCFNGIGSRFNVSYKRLLELMNRFPACNFKMVVDKNYGQIAVRKDGTQFDFVEMEPPKVKKQDPDLAVSVDAPGSIPVLGAYNIDAVANSSFNQSCQEKLVLAMVNMQKLTPYYYTVFCAIKRAPAPIGTMGVTEDTLYYDQKFVAQLQVPELTFVLIHEILHIAMQHSLRFGNRTSHKLWNIATDLYINSIICNDFDVKFGQAVKSFGNNTGVSLKTPEFGVYIETIGETIDLNTDTPETIYNRLMKENNNGIPQAGGGNSGGSQQNQGQQGQAQQGQQGQQQQQGGVGSNGGQAGGQQGQSQQMQAAAQQIADGIKQVQEGARRAQQQCGNGNGSKEAGNDIQQGLNQIQQATNDVMSGKNQQSAEQQAQNGMQSTQNGINQMNQALQSSPQAKQQQKQQEGGGQQGDSGSPGQNQQSTGQTGNSGSPTNGQQGNGNSGNQGGSQSQSGSGSQSGGSQQGNTPASQSGQGQSSGSGSGGMTPQEQMQRGMNQIQQGLSQLMAQQQGGGSGSGSGQQGSGQGQQQGGQASGSGAGSTGSAAGGQLQDKSQGQGQGSQSNLTQDDLNGDPTYRPMEEASVIYNGKKLTGTIMRDVMTSNGSKKKEDVQAKMDASRNALQKIKTKIKMEEEEQGVESLAKNAGMGGSLTMRHIEVGLSAGLDWRVLFRNICKDKPKKTFTLAQPNQDYMNMGMTLADRRRIGKPERVSHVKFAVDVSGSVSEKELRATLSEINNIFNYFKVDGELIYWSTMIGDAGQFSNLKDMLKVQPETTGGTDVRCVFDYLSGQSKVHGKAEKDRVRDMKGIFIITDGCFSMNFGDYKEMFGKRVVWLITGLRGNTITFNPPFGRVLALDIDKDY